MREYVGLQLFVDWVSTTPYAATMLKQVAEKRGQTLRSHADWQRFVMEMLSLGVIVDRGPHPSQAGKRNFSFFFDRLPISQRPSLFDDQDKMRRAA